MLTLEGTLLTASEDTRVLTYMLLPYGEPGRTSAGTVTAARGAITVPQDVSTLSANIQHDRHQPAARVINVDDTPSGLIASVRALQTTRGNDLLVEATEGVRRGVSVELDNPVIRGGQLLAGVLSGMGFVVAPAFPSALLVASDTEPEDDGFGPAGHLAGLALSTARTPDENDDTPAPAEGDSDDDDQTDADDDEEENDVTDTIDAAAAPAGLRASRAGTAPNPYDLGGAVAFLADSWRSGGAPALTAALSDITVAGVGVNAIPPAWIGELWAGRTYQRRYVPLVSNLPLRGMTLKGWKWGVKPAVATYAGNKAAVTSNVPTTTAVSVAVQRLAGAHDVDRAFRDFEVTEFWESYYRAMTDSYAALSDAACLTDLIAAATAPAAPGSGLSTWTPAQSIVKGALAVIAANGTPTAAIVGADLYETLLLTPQQNVIELLSGGIGWSESQASGFSIVPSSSGALTGKALVLDKAGFVFAELPGSPIRVEAINQANAGIDPGVFGYYADYAIDPLLLQLISKPTA